MIAILVTVFYCYVLIGVIFALWFTIKGVNRLDAGMTNAPAGVRVLIFPGSVLLWPVLLIRYLKSR